MPLLVAVESARALLDSGMLVSSKPELAAHEGLQDLGLLTAKPVIYAFNVGEEDLKNTEKLETLKKLVSPQKAVFINAQFEHELNDLDDDDASEMLSLSGLKESGLEQVIHAAYEALQLQSYLTAGGKEVRAWHPIRSASSLAYRRNVPRHWRGASICPSR